MKILIVQPKQPTCVKLFNKPYMSQLTLPSIAAQISKEHKIIITDENVENIDFNIEIDLVCITAMTPAAPRAYEIADEFRKKGVKVLMGGVHVSALPQEALNHSDSVVIGEVEGLFNQIIEDINRNNLKPIYKLDEKPKLNNLPIPRHDLMNKDMYVNIPKVETSRGCPFTCDFCSTTEFFGNKMRYRPVQDVVDEIKALSYDFYFFTDNNIIGNPKYAKELFKALIPLKIKWISQCSINFAKDQELLKLAAKSGCVGMLIGFESLSEATISNMGKKVNQVDSYSSSIKKIHKAGIGIIGCFVFGFDDDDEKVFKNTIKFIRKNNIDMPQITILTPFPGTELRKNMLKESRILHSDWRYYDATHVVFQPKWITVKELRDKYDWAASKIYSSRSIFWRMIKSLFRLRKLYKTIVFWQVNIVYRRLWLVSTDDNDHLIKMKSKEFTKLNIKSEIENDKQVPSTTNEPVELFRNEL